MIPPETLAHAAQMQRHAVEVREEITKALKEGDRETLKKYGRESELEVDDGGISPQEAWKRHLLRVAKRAAPTCTREPGDDDA